LKNIESLADYIITVPDFPKPGILFRDISPLLKQHFNQTIDAFSNLLTQPEWNTIDLLAGIDSRGFIFASALAYKHNKGFLKVRKYLTFAPALTTGSNMAVTVLRCKKAITLGYY